jgi:alanine racemase
MVPHPTWMDVDLDALSDNLAEVQRKVGPATKVIASLKANAYGHGVVPIARRLAAHGVNMLSTGSFRDAVALREAGIDTPILMFGASLPAAMPEFVSYGLTPTVHNAEIADAIPGSEGPPVSVFIKVDCGFGRLGIPLRQARQFVLGVSRRPNIEIAGLYTHLPFYDQAGCDWACERIAKFDDLVATLTRDGLTIPITQARASAAIVAGIEDSCTAVCPGGILYGNSPVKGVGDASVYRPVMTGVSTRLIHISHDASDRTPGYEGIYADRVKTMTGVVPFGRTDGNRAAAPGKSPYMLVGCVKAPILGVSLEHCVLDLSAVESPQVGDDVVVLGGSGHNEITLARIAEWWGLGMNDILMTFNERIRQRFPEGESS